MPAFHFRQRLPGFFRAAPYPQILNIPEINDLGQRGGLAPRASIHTGRVIMLRVLSQFNTATRISIKPPLYPGLQMVRSNSPFSSREAPTALES